LLKRKVRSAFVTPRAGYDDDNAGSAGRCAHIIFALALSLLLGHQNPPRKGLSSMQTNWPWKGRMLLRKSRRRDLPTPPPCPLSSLATSNAAGRASVRAPVHSRRYSQPARRRRRARARGNSRRRVDFPSGKKEVSVVGQRPRQSYLSPSLLFCV